MEKSTNQVSGWCVVSLASITLIMTPKKFDAYSGAPNTREMVGITSFQSSMIITSYSVAAGPPIMSLGMKKFPNISYIAAGVLSVILLFIVIKFIKVYEFEKSNKTT